MRQLLIILPVFALAACQVNRDEDNGTITAEFNEEVAENTARDVGNEAERIGSAIANEADEAIDRAQNVDVDVDVDTNTADNRN